MVSRKIILTVFIALALSACEEEATLSKVDIGDQNNDVVDNIELPAVDEGDPIVVLSNNFADAESSNEILSDDETNLPPEDSDVPFSDFPFDDQPEDDNPGDDTPGDDTPGDDTPGDDTPGDDTPGDDTPGDDTPGDDTPGDDTPEDDTPGDDTPGDDSPGDDNPSDDEIDDETDEDEENEEKCRKRGNLIRNGSFEISDNRLGLRGLKLASINKKKWDVFQSLPGGKAGQDSWYTSKGPGIEVQGDKTVAKAPHGNRVVELDSHGAENTNSTMSQDVLLCRGKHVLKFMYYPRTKTEGDNIIEVRIGDKVIKSVDMVKDGKWIRVRAPFRVRKMQKYTISFAAKGKDNSLGGLVDRIRLHKRKRRAGVVTSLISLGDQDNISSPLIRREIASAAIRKFVNFASLKKNPKILFVKDGNHNNESLDDFVLTEAVLKELYGNENVSVWSQDLRLQNAQGYDVIYVINPGFPMGSSITARTLLELKKTGRVGIVIHGDDMSRGENFNLSKLTGLKYKANGTEACGIVIDNNQGGKYKLKLRKRFFKKLSIESRTMEYANDIDHTEVMNKRVRIFAMAKAPSGCDIRVPAVVGYKLKRPKRSSK